nr:MAG TPA: hypothetical protein [Caudoviricetes sp.]
MNSICYHFVCNFLPCRLPCRFSRITNEILALKTKVIY